MRFASLSTLGLALAVGACGDQVSAPESEAVDAVPAENTSASLAEKPASLANDPASCKRDADGQRACFVQAFKLEECNEVSVLGSMFRENEEEGSYSHRTAFGANGACVAELRAAAPKHRLREGEQDTFVLNREEGYREMLIIGLQISQDGSVVEWERTKE